MSHQRVVKFFAADTVTSRVTDMAILIVQTPDRPLAAEIRRRVLIGRKQLNGVQFDDRQVSRIHAWIDQDDTGQFYIADAASRGGTKVNGSRIAGHTPLHDGDEIVIGHNKIIYRSRGRIPASAIVFDIAQDGTNPAMQHEGILTTCECGAPVWAPQRLAGVAGRCRTCNRELTLPGKPVPGGVRPVDPNDSVNSFAAISDKDIHAELATRHSEFESLESNELPSGIPHPQPTPAICDICRDPIQVGSPTTECPSCGKICHTDCWKENHGCAAYGCAEAGGVE